MIDKALHYHKCDFLFSSSLFCGEKDNGCVSYLLFQLYTFLNQGSHLFLLQFSLPTSTYRLSISECAKILIDWLAKLCTWTPSLGDFLRMHCRLRFPKMDAEIETGAYITQHGEMASL